jgi:DNA polymerase III epsilon subunit-like protein
MNRIENIRDKSAYFIFDLEFIGNVQQLTTCQIWEISVFSQSTGQWFTKVVDPQPHTKTFPIPPVPELPQLTREFLTQHKALTWDTVLGQLVAWVAQQTTRIPIFISHNTFKADKPILELESRRYNCLLPLHWFFFDSLHFCREFVRSPTSNFSLSGLHQQLFQKPIANAHRARNDVVACTAILKSITNDSWLLSGPIYSVYTTSLRTIKWVGKKAEKVLGISNIRSVEMLMEIVKNNALTDHIYHRLDSNQSIQKTIQNIMCDQLPLTNIQNICKSVSCMYHPSLLSLAIASPTLIH